jgi:hypothetical protein
MEIIMNACTAIDPTMVAMLKVLRDNVACLVAKFILDNPLVDSCNVVLVTEHRQDNSVRYRVEERII